MNKRQQLIERLGYDPAEAFLFHMGVPPAKTVPVASDMERALAIINGSPYVKTKLGAEDVYIHTIEAASSRYIADRFMFLGISTLQNLAADATAGIAFMTRHAHGGFAGDGENPYGRTFAGQLEQLDSVSRVLIQLYMLADHTPNGQAAASTTDLHRGMMGGTLFDASIGLKQGGQRVCDICLNDLFSLNCSHFPGTAENMTPAEVAAQITRGIPSGAATYTVNDAHVTEVSLVYDGAVPNAGTGLSSSVPDLGRPRVAAAITPNKGASMKPQEEIPAAEQLETTADALTPETFAALRAENDRLKKVAKDHETLAEQAKTEKLSAEAKTKVDGWKRAGKLSGNGATKFEALAVAVYTGQPVTREMFDAACEALSQLPTTRLSEDAPEHRENHDNRLSADDFKSADKGNHAMKTRIDLYVKSLCVADPKKNYVAHLREARAAAFAR